MNGGQRELMGRQGRGLVEAPVRLGGGRRATRSGRQAGERRKNREREGKREKEREIEEETLMSSSEVSETERGGEWTGGWSTAWERVRGVRGGRADFMQLRDDNNDGLQDRRYSWGNAKWATGLCRPSCTFARS